VTLDSLSDSEDLIG
jgi:hypothetical protein